jgi:hypothetical protein
MSWTALTARASHWHAMHTHMLPVRHGICWAITKMNDGWHHPPQKVISGPLKNYSGFWFYSGPLKIYSGFWFYAGRP